MIAPILEEIAAEHAGKLRIAKLNVDDNPDIARRFDVMSIPTLIVFQDGQPEKRMVGAKGKGQLLEELERRHRLIHPIRFSTMFHTGCGQRQPSVEPRDSRRHVEGPGRVGPARQAGGRSAVMAR